jgi:hypothetical protein
LYPNPRKTEVLTLRVLRNPKGDPGNTVEVNFSDYGIVAGVRVTAEYGRKDGYYPKEFRGQVETVYPVFAVVRTVAGYRATIDLSDLICSFIYVLVHGRAAAARVPTVAVARRKESRHANKALVSAGL